MQKEIYYKELAHTITVAEKSLGLHLASWTHRTANGIVPVQKAAGLRPKKSRCFSSNPSLKAGEDRCSSSVVRQEGFPLT